MMVKQTLQEIPVDKILANFSQPREEFDKDKVKELAESILSNGLINPIIVRTWKDKFMIVAGERRWTAHKVAGLKNITAFVKEYDNDVDWQIESLIENWQREDLTSKEKENYLWKIWESNKFRTHKELANKLGVSESNIKDIIYAKQIREKSKHADSVSTRTLTDLRKIKNQEDREKILKKIKENKIPVTSESIRKVAKVITLAPPDVKKSLLNDDITVEQAERISKLKTTQQREKAIKEHKVLDMVSKRVEKNIDNQESAKEKRQFDKGLIQSGNWVQSFRNSVTESNKYVERTIKILLLATKFIPMMDDKQKERLDIDLDRLIDNLERGLQLSEQIKSKI